MPQIINYHGVELQVNSIMDVQINAFMLALAIAIILLGVALRNLEK
jgi:hypothetical protein